MAKPIIIDCDPGVDDAVALLFAFAAPDALDILGVTTVAGNVGAERTARNARVIREIAERENVPVFAGAEAPLFRLPIEADHFHGVSGLGDLKFTEPKAPLAPGRSAAFIVETLRGAAARSVTLVVTGPMTNVALAFLFEPAIKAGVAEIVLMGGARGEGGNITASAEYNIYADPHAAEIVFKCGLPIVALGLDVTHKVRTNPARMHALAKLGSKRAKAAVDLLRFGETVELKHAKRTGSPMHDQSTIAYVLQPELFQTRACTISVETNSPLTLGHTAVEFRLPPDDPGRVHWAVDADADGVFELMTRRLA
ncbi:MAG: nucleoside hydrolase [Caulobacterales bacterium]|jgi:purine nucleosidase|nr:nucleoside hydrolase [Caulobacterales bacterium]